MLKNFNINVESKAIAEIDKLAAERGISRSAWIREAIEEYLLSDVGIDHRVKKLEIKTALLEIKTTLLEIKTTLLEGRLAKIETSGEW